MVSLFSCWFWLPDLCLSLLLPHLLGDSLLVILSLQTQLYCRELAIQLKVVCAGL